MATERACRKALAAVVARLAEVDPELRRRHVVDRTVSCRLTDLEVTFTGTFRDGELVNLTTKQVKERAQVRLTTTSDDLVALTDGSLPLRAALTRGRLRVDASMVDLLRLRSLM